MYKYMGGTRGKLAPTMVCKWTLNGKQTFLEALFSTVFAELTIVT